MAYYANRRTLALICPCYFMSASDKNLSYGAFEGDLEKFLGFYGKLHRQFVHHFFGVAVDDESDGIFDANAALLTVEELVLVNLGSCCFVFDGRCRIRDNHIGESVSTAFIAEQQTVALAVIAGIFRLVTHFDESAVSVLAVTCGDTLGDNTAARVFADMNHLGSCIGLLVVIGHSHRVELRRRVIAAKDTGRVFPSDSRAGFHLRPREACILVRNASFGNEIIYSALAVLVTRILVLHR